MQVHCIWSVSRDGYRRGKYSSTTKIGWLQTSIRNFAVPLFVPPTCPHFLLGGGHKANQSVRKFFKEFNDFRRWFPALVVSSTKMLVNCTQNQYTVYVQNYANCKFDCPRIAISMDKSFPLQLRLHGETAQFVSAIYYILYTYVSIILVYSDYIFIKKLFEKYYVSLIHNCINCLAKEFFINSIMWYYLA